MAKRKIKDRNQLNLFSQPPEKSIGTAGSNFSSSSVPVIIETLDRPKFFSMVRCDYLSFEYSEPRPDWLLRFDGGTGLVPFLMLELVGIIQRPIRQETFNEPSLIDDLFEELEDKGGLLVNFEDIWLPRLVFNHAIDVGNVFRIDNDLFQHAYAFREGRLAEDAFLRTLKMLGGRAMFSEDETRAFGEWGKKQVYRAQHSDPKDPTLQLKLREGYREEH